MTFGSGSTDSALLGHEAIKLHGPAAEIELAIGGTPVPGLVIGGSVSVTVASPNVSGQVENAGSLASATGTAGALTSSLIAAFVDFYPDPTGGFHVQGAIGPTSMKWAAGPSSASPQVPASDLTGGGFGGSLGVGYEWWVGSQWSIGGLARLKYGSASLKPTQQSQEEVPKLSLSTWTPAALVVVTYH